MNPALLAKIAQAAAEQPQVGPGLFPGVTPGRVLHLDGDYLAYFASGNDDTEPGMARRNAFDRIELTRLRCGAESVTLHLSASGCTKAHRFLIATVKPYQGQRNASRKPKNWAYLREVLEHYEGPRFKPKVWVTREADDGMAYCAALDAARRTRSPDEFAKILAVISTRDKDMRMLPGLHVNWMTYQLTEVAPGAWDVIGEDGDQYGLKWFYLQLLQGDNADNIPGVPRLFGSTCGDARAAKFLATAHDRDEAYDRVQAAYADFYRDLWPDALIEQAGLLWLRTDAQASLANIAEAFPTDPRLSAALDRLTERVTQGLNDLAKIKGP
ncbi:phosphodiesterase [Ralstonia solanacearum]|uniref:phosphodiesterase n=2 Tax=Ralstonia solanacearum TaxID=305 RepID=UPI001E57329E|nr:phosphodiesterase [Ralstonia solanacearum]